MYLSGFDPLLDDLCKNIASARERAAVRSELADHLTCKYESLTAKGVDPQTALLLAEEALGDREALRRQLQRLHSYKPTPSVKKAMLLLLIGLTISSVQIELFQGMRQLMILAGELLILTGLFCFIKTNAPLRRAFVWKTISFEISVIGYSFALFFTDVPAFSIACTGLKAVCDLFFCIYFLRGYQLLTAPYASKAQKPLRYQLVTVFWIINTLMPLLSILIPISKQTTLIAAVMAAVFVFSVLYLFFTLQLLFRADRLLAHTDHDYLAEHRKQVKCGVFCILLAFCLVVAFTGNLIYLKQPVKPAHYTLSDTSLSASACDAARKKLLRYGIPQEIVDRLPNSELQRYQNAPTNADEANAATITLCEEENCSVVFTEYMIPVSNDRYRLLRNIGIRAPSFLRGTYILDEMVGIDKSRSAAGGSAPLPQREDEFLLLLRSENDAQCTDLPLRGYKNTNGKLTGFDFQPGDNIDIFFAADYTAGKDVNTYVFRHAILLYRWPVIGLNRTGAEILRSSNLPAFNSRLFSRYDAVSNAQF